MKRTNLKVKSPYTSADRYYHNTEHLINIHHLLQPYTDVDTKLVLLIFYHDYVYNPGSDDNEQLSANAAVEDYPEYGEWLYKGITATKLHTETDDHIINLFLDADMAILSSSPAKYAEYVMALRKEYCSFPDEQWTEGRVQFLRQWKGFITKEFDTDYGEAAKRNVENELRLLTKENLTC